MSRRATTALVAGVIVIFVVFLAWRAPASLVADAAGESIPGLVLSGVTGSAWHGAARSATLRGRPLGAVQWRLAPTSVLGGRVRADIELRAPGVSLDARIVSSLDGSRLTLSRANGIAPLAWLEGVSGARGPVDGTVAIQDGMVEVDGQLIVAADGVARLTDAVITRPQHFPLGDFTLELSERDGWLNGEVVEASGPVQVAGDVRMTADRRWEVDARVRIPGADRNMEMVLSLLGEPDADGYRPLRLRGSY